MDALTRYCPRLTYLSLSDCTMITDASMRYIATSLRLLTELQVENCTRVSDGGIHAVQERCVLLHTFVKPS